MASLEGGLGAVATSSGQAAELLAFIGLAGAGEHLVASPGCTAARVPCST